MKKLSLTIDGFIIEAEEGQTILKAAQTGGIYIPALCFHPDLPPCDTVAPSHTVYQGSRRSEGTLEGYQSCQVCVVEIEGEGIWTSCNTPVKDGMIVHTDTPEIKERRQENVSRIFFNHPHSCIVCPQREGCDLRQCTSNVPENERCCPEFSTCELRKVAEYVGLRDDIPRYIPQGLPSVEDDPLFNRYYDLCIGCTRCVRVCNQVREVGALSFTIVDGKVVVGTVEPTIRDSGCKFCTACVEVCPTGALRDKKVRPGKKEEDIVPCKHNCPANIDIPGYLRLIAEGKADEANAVIREKVPFPGVLGRVCIHPCEEVCRRGDVNEPISICALKRYAADREAGLWKKYSLVKDDTGKKVAVIGAGPGGLTAAFYLRKQGHAVTLFEFRSKPGGMMRYGIPFYRLPENILDKEIGDILDLGIEFKPNQTLGKDFSLENLTSDGFDTVFLGIGAQLSRRISIDGTDLEDVLWGVDFLVDMSEGKAIQVKNRVIVIGGGNVAIDVARSVIRCGAKEVTVACLESREEMPAHDWEIEESLEEGIRLMPSWGPQRIVSEGSRVTGVALVRCTSVFDEAGNFSPTFDETTKTIIQGDQVIIAIGQASDLSSIPQGSSISVNKGLIVIDQDSFETGMKGVYAGGDVVKVPGAIIHAIAAGRRAASSIDKALGGSGAIDEVFFPREQPNQRLGRDEGFAGWPREKVSQLAREKRFQGFQEVTLGYDREKAIKEAKRCLRCDLRLQISPSLLPPEKWLDFSEGNIETVPEIEGVFQLLDSEKNIMYIKGAMNVREELKERLRSSQKARYFIWEEDPMYTKRESELLQHFMQQHGRLPEGNAEIDDDLF
ncbi:MAG: FAD-dependent oxidoreductase [Pseudomonadota bacterium]